MYLVTYLTKNSTIKYKSSKNDIDILYFNIFVKTINIPYFITSYNYSYLKENYRKV